MKIRYYKLEEILRKRGTTLEGLRRRLDLLPSDIAKIETNRFLGILPNLLICKYLRCDTFDLMDVFPEEDGTPPELFANWRMLEKYSYKPDHYIAKEFEYPLKFQ